MTDKVDQQLNDLLDINTDIKQETNKVQLPSRIDNIETDYKYARENLYNLVERGQDAIDGILELSKETEHPRAYEVAGQLINNVADATDKLLDLQKKLKDVEEEKQVKGPSTVNNALFVGSTADLAKMLKDGLKEDNK